MAKIIKIVCILNYYQFQLSYFSFMKLVNNRKYIRALITPFISAILIVYPVHHLIF